MKDRDSNLLESSEDLLHTIPRLLHAFRPLSTLELPDGSQVSLGQLHLLRGIHAGCRTVSDLAENGNVSLPTISRKLDLLVEKGLVSRRRDPMDRRTLVLEVTPEGNRTLSGMRSTANRRLSQHLAALSDEELAMIHTSLHLLRKVFSIPEDDHSPWRQPER